MTTLRKTIYKNQISYRLRMVGVDGALPHSPIENMDFEKPTQSLLFPERAADMASIQMESSDDISSLRRMSIYDTTGKLILSPELTSESVDVNALKNGFYVVQVLKKNDQMAP